MLNIWKYNSVKVAFVVAVLFSITSVIISYLFSFLIVDNVGDLIKITSLIVFVYIINAFLLALREKTAATANYYLKMNLNEKIDKAMADKSYSEFRKKDSGEHASLYVNDVTQINNLIFNKKLSLVSKFVVAAASLIALLKIHYSMACIAIVSVVILLIAPVLFQKKLSKCIIESQECKKDFLNRIRELLQGFSTFLENNAFTFFFRKSSEVSNQYADAICRSDTFAGVMSGVLTLVEYIITITSLAALSYLVIIGKVSEGAFLSILTLMPSFCGAVMEFMSERTFYKSGIELYNEKLAAIDKEYINNKEYIKPFIKRKYRKPRYDKQNIDNTIETNLLETRNLSVKFADKSIKFPEKIIFEKGKKYALIGSSGCGKSTFLKALIGEINNYDGDIFIDKEIKNKGKTLFDSIAYFNQNTYLFNDTVRNNILLNNDMSDDELIDLLKAVRLEEFSPDYIISENGNNLSGGQRQRIALARVLARKKKILILDEATANLDLDTAAFIEDFVFKSDWMIIMVSHHISESVKSRLDEEYNFSK